MSRLMVGTLSGRPGRGVRCRTNACAPRCWSAASRPPSSPRRSTSTRRPSSGGSAGARRTGGTATPSPRTSAWTRSYLWPDALSPRPGRHRLRERDRHRLPAPLGRPVGPVARLLRQRRAGDRRPRLQRTVPRRGRRHLSASSAQGRGRRHACASCSATRTARRSPSAAPTRASATRMGGKIRNALVLLPAAARGRRRRVPACTARCSTTRSTAPTTNCWSTPTSTASPPRRPRCCTCAGSPAATWSPPTWKASSACGTAPRPLE